MTLLDFFDLHPIIFRVVVICFCAVIALAIFFFAGDDLKSDLQADAAVKITDRVQRAVKRFYADIGSYPIEYSDVPHTTYLAHNLYRPTGSEQWHGPYIVEPLAAYTSPFNSTIRVYNYIEYGNAFDLNSDGAADTKGSGSYITFLNVPTQTAKKIDKRLEALVIPEHWHTRGRVKYSQETGLLSVYLAGGK